MVRPAGEEVGGASLVGFISLFDLHNPDNTEREGEARRATVERDGGKGSRR